MHLLNPATVDAVVCRLSGHSVFPTRRFAFDHPPGKGPSRSRPALGLAKVGQCDGATGWVWGETHHGRHLSSDVGPRIDTHRRR